LHNIILASAIQILAKYMQDTEVSLSQTHSFSMQFLLISYTIEEIPRVALEWNNHEWHGKSRLLPQGTCNAS
jgi:hypothetical protein